MMNYQYLLILCVKIMSISTAPLQLQYQSQLSLQPTQEELLQQQLFALQQLQNLQMMNEWNNYYPPAILENRAQPMIILLPESQISGWADKNNEFNNDNGLITKNNEVKDKETNDSDLDSVVIEAEPQLEPKPEPTPHKTILLVPNTRRFSIGGIISAIPFLPIEINVPDSISWIYDGISGIISGIGNRFPFKKPQTKTMLPQEDNIKMIIKRLQKHNPHTKMPILMLPDVAQMYPMPIPMQFN